MKNKVNLKISHHKLIITPIEQSREGWAKSFQNMAKNKDDAVLDIAEVNHSWDDEEWSWEGRAPKLQLQLRRK